MATRVYGPKAHTITLTHTAADIAKLIRTDLKAAVDAGELPATFGYRVTSEQGSTSEAINILVTGASDNWLYTTEKAYTGVELRVHSEAAIALQRKIEEIRTAYGWDGSDIQSDYFDVRYYGSVRIESESHARYRVQEAERRKALTAYNKWSKAGGKLRRVKADRYEVLDRDGVVLGTFTVDDERTPAGGVRRVFTATPAGHADPIGTRGAYQTAAWLLINH